MGCVKKYVRRIRIRIRKNCVDPNPNPSKIIRIRIHFADLDPAFLVNADPDPGEMLKR
jgi:hypothetical protein